jgi:uncharacterized membrane protein (UPF0127 family)
MKFDYQENGETKSLDVVMLTSVYEKLSGLMFKRSSKPLLFVFEKEQPISIHSLFCKPFTAIWLDKNKFVVKKEIVNYRRYNIKGYGKYLIEILL